MNTEAEVISAVCKNKDISTLLADNVDDIFIEFWSLNDRHFKKMHFDKDENDFEKCGLREFREETGIDISNCHDTLSREKLKKGFRFTHFNTFKPKNKFKCSNERHGCFR